MASSLDGSRDLLMRRVFQRYCYYYKQPPATMSTKLNFELTTLKTWETISFGC